MKIWACILDPFSNTQLIDLPIAFFGENAWPVDPCIPTEPCLPSDPPYVISFLDGPNGAPVGVRRAVPEPAPLALLALGLIGLLVLRVSPRAGGPRSALR